MRTVEIEIGGNTYTLCLTLWAYGQICGRYESMKGCLQRLDEVSGKFEQDPDTGEIRVLQAEDTPALIEEYLWLLDTLMGGGFQCKGITTDVPQLPDFREVLCPGDIPYVQKKVFEAITAGQAREVGAQAPKNGAGGEGGPAPES